MSIVGGSGSGASAGAAAGSTVAAPSLAEVGDQTTKRKTGVVIFLPGLHRTELRGHPDGRRAFQLQRVGAGRSGELHRPWTLLERVQPWLVHLPLLQELAAQAVAFARHQRSADTLREPHVLGTGCGRAWLSDRFGGGRAWPSRSNYSDPRSSRGKFDGAVGRCAATVGER